MPAVFLLPSQSIILNLHQNKQTSLNLLPALDCEAMERVCKTYEDSIPGTGMFTQSYNLILAHFHPSLRHQFSQPIV